MSVTATKEERRFIVDANVGRLVTWLRVMGYDTLDIPQVDDNDIIPIAFKGGRTVVIRDAQLAERRLGYRGKPGVGPDNGLQAPWTDPLTGGGSGPHLW